jgi:hypothetical protein
MAWAKRAPALRLPGDTVRHCTHGGRKDVIPWWGALQLYWDPCLQCACLVTVLFMPCGCAVHAMDFTVCVCVCVMRRFLVNGVIVARGNDETMELKYGGP